MVGTDPLHRLRQVGPGGGVGDGVHGQSPGLYRLLYVPLVGFQGGASEVRASHPKRPQAGHPVRARQLLVSALCTANAVGRLRYHRSEFDEVLKDIRIYIHDKLKVPQLD